MAQLPSQSQFGDYGEWPGRDVLDSGGERLGGVREIYLDRETGRPEWVLVDVDGDESRFVPLADAAVEASTIRVAHSAAAIRSAPGIGAEPRIDQSEERRLYDHYGIGYHEAGSGLPAEEPEPEPLVPPWRSQEKPAPFVAPEPSSWSEVAGEEEASNLAPPLPGEPPSAEELEAADIPEPPAASEPALGPDSPTEVTTPSSAGEILATGAGKPDALAPGPEPELLSPPTSEPDALSAGTPPADPIAAAPDALSPGTPATDPITAGAPDPVASDLTAQHGPDAVGVFSAPSPPTPPDAVEPDPAPEAARPFTPPPPPAPEPPAGGALDVLKTSRGRITAGVAIAAVLFFIVRRLR